MSLTEQEEQLFKALGGRVTELEKLLGLPNPSGGGLVESNGSSWKKVDTIDTTQVALPRHSGKLLDLQDYLNSTQASGKISGGGFTDNTDGTITVAGGAGLVRAANDALDEVEFFSWIENDNVTLTDESTNYIIVTHGDTPTVSATVTKSDGNNRNVILLGKVFREATVLHFVEAGMLITELAKNVLSYLTQVHGEVIRASGYAVAETGERYLTTTNGVLFAGLTRLTTTGIDTSGADTFEIYYYDGDLGTPAWVESSASQIDNANWNDVATGLDTLTANRYGVHWVYGDPDGHLMVVYGQGDYTLALAEAAHPPSSLPAHVTDFGFLAAKIIVQEGEANLYTIESAYETTFTPSGAADHGELAGLADKDHSAYLENDGDQMDGDLIIDNTSTEALLVRKNSDGGDVLAVDTTNSEVEVTGDALISSQLAVGGGAVGADIIGALTTADDSNVSALAGTLTGGSTVDGAHYYRGLSFDVLMACDDTKTNTGYFMGSRQSSLGRAGLVGTVALNYGAYTQHGIFDGAGTITTSYGYYLRTYHKTGTITTSYGIYLKAPDTGGTVGTEYAMYIADNALTYLVGAISVLDITDRTPYYEGDALEEIKKIKSKDKKIDHDTLPEFVQVKRKKNKALKELTIIEEVEVSPGEFVEIESTVESGDELSGNMMDGLEKGKDYEEVEVKERSLGNMISVLTKAVQQLTDRVEELEN